MTQTHFQVLSLPVGEARRGVHDDITVTVVYFDFDYIRKQKGARGVDLYPGQNLVMCYLVRPLKHHKTVKGLLRS